MTREQPWRKMGVRGVTYGCAVERWPRLILAVRTGS